MRQEIIGYIHQQPLLKNYLRENPHWYRRLARNPSQLQSFEVSSLSYYKKTIPDQVEKISNGVQMASMMLGMLQAMKNRD